MKRGIYNNIPPDWPEFEVVKFVPHLFCEEHGDGCGNNTLALLTGIDPTKINNTNRKSPNNWKDSFMVKFLLNHGLKVADVTMCNVSDSSIFFCSDSITNRHVLLISQLMAKNEASWAVAHNKLWYHNFQTCSFNALNLVNNPLLTCYVVHHPDWGKYNELHWY